MAERDHSISASDLNKAHRLYVKNEPRDLFYRAATELVALAIKGKTTLSVTEALAVLLQTWNSAFYRFRKFDDAHFARFESPYKKHRTVLDAYRKRAIDSLVNDEQTEFSHLFEDFESVLGPVGAAKALHLLAPDFFPLWDRAIARAHGLPLAKTGLNAPRYWSFTLITRSQCTSLQLRSSERLKALDEYNYAKHKRGWHDRVAITLPAHKLAHSARCAGRNSARWKSRNRSSGTKRRSSPALRWKRIAAEP